MLTFIIIGLLCNSEACYWARVSGMGEYRSFEICVAHAKEVKEVTIMYFDTACMVK